jgi:hypothetical protein
MRLPHRALFLDVFITVAIVSSKSNAVETAPNFVLTWSHLVSRSPLTAL